MNPCFDTLNSNWPSEESRQVVSNYNYGCGDTISVLDGSENNDEVDSSNRIKIPNIERCLSCISKLGIVSGGATSMSQCSNTTQTPSGDQNPVWNLYIERKHNQSHNQLTSLDLMSMCSRESSNNSEYSIPRQKSSTKTLCESVYGKIQPQSQANSDNQDQSSQSGQSQQFSSLQKQSCASCSTCHYNLNKFQKVEIRKNIGPYDNYDTPKSTTTNIIENHQHLPHPSHNPRVTAFENYDTPRKLQEYLGNDGDHNFGNYDKPAAIGISTTSTEGRNDGTLPSSSEKAKRLEAGNRSAIDCTCNKVMTWADNWISLPYCKRGNSIENTSLPMTQIQMKSNEALNQSPSSGGVVRENDEMPVYATIDMNKKSNKRGDAETIRSSQESSVAQAKVHANYVNLSFEKSLNNYENSRKFLTKLNSCESQIDETDDKNVIRNAIDEIEVETDGDKVYKNDNYMIMEPRKIPPTLYIPMAPVNNSYNLKSSSTLPSRTSNVKCLKDNRFACSTLTREGNDGSGSRKRCVSVDGKIEKIHNEESVDKKPIVQHLIGEKCVTSLSSSLSSHSHPISDNKSSSIKIPISSNQTETEDEVSESTNASHISSSYIRRSESVPCKTQNRDSSSSNDSGVSTGSLRQRGTDFYDFELPLTTAMSGRCLQKHVILHTASFHTSLPRRSKSFDPLRDISFLFPKSQVPNKSNPNDADNSSLLNPKNSIPNRIALSRPLFIDSRSTSSGTSSDMSDYIETLSLSSHSSSETQDSLR